MKGLRELTWQPGEKCDSPVKYNTWSWGQITVLWGGGRWGMYSLSGGVGALG